jgi:glycine dehydrogenase subunit 2
MTMNPSGWRPEMSSGDGGAGAAPTFTGNRALMLEEPLIFEIGDSETTGVDLEAPPRVAGRLAGLERNKPIGLAGLSEPETVRHYTRLSRQNYAIDLGLFPLGSCTMKHNPRLNEKVARMPGFADIHPLQPTDTVQGALALIEMLGEWLIKLTGMHSVGDEPQGRGAWRALRAAGDRAALEARGDARQVILVPESAHGTNPATAAFAATASRTSRRTTRGRGRSRRAEGAAGPDVAGVMITNPNTCGLFEPDMSASRSGASRRRPRLLRRRQFQRDRRRSPPGRPRHRCDAHQPPQDLLDAPRRRRARARVRLSFGSADALRAVAVRRESKASNSPGRGGDGRGASWFELRPMTAFHGQMGMFTRAMSYILSHGADGFGRSRAMRCSTPITSSASSRMSSDAPFGQQRPLHARGPLQRQRLPGRPLHARSRQGLIDEGYHPMTMYFPLVVHGAMLIEPTETESKAALDQFIGALARWPSAPRPATCR